MNVFEHLQSKFIFNAPFSATGDAQNPLSGLIGLSIDDDEQSVSLLDVERQCRRLVDS
jgi:hypothetical protein